MKRKQGKDAWKHDLHSGDEVTIDSGDNELPPSVIISSIEYLPGNVVRILTIDGEKIECFIKDLS